MTCRTPRKHNPELSQIIMAKVGSAENKWTIQLSPSTSDNRYHKCIVNLSQQYPAIHRSPTYIERGLWDSDKKNNQEWKDNEEQFLIIKAFCILR